MTTFCYDDAKLRVATISLKRYFTSSFVYSLILSLKKLFTNPLENYSLFTVDDAKHRVPSISLKHYFTKKFFHFMNNILLLLIP